MDATLDGFAKGKCDGFFSSLDSWSDGGGLLSVLTTDSEMSASIFGVSWVIYCSSVCGFGCGGVEELNWWVLRVYWTKFFSSCKAFFLTLEKSTTILLSSLKET